MCTHVFACSCVFMCVFVGVCVFVGAHTVGHIQAAPPSSDMAGCVLHAVWPVSCSAVPAFSEARSGWSVAATGPPSSSPSFT